MAESWFSLSRKDQAEALEVASASTGRAPHLLEKDIWVVWALAAIYACSFAEKLTFKGGTSLSKVYKIIDRFSEDIDLTYDIRELVPNLLEAGNPLPINASQAKKMTDAVRRELPEWIQQTVKPELDLALNTQGLEAQFSRGYALGDERRKNVLGKSDCSARLLPTSQAEGATLLKALV